MTELLDCLGLGLVCPGAVAYLYLLNDQWRAPAWARRLFLLLCGPASVGLTWVLRALPAAAQAALIWAVVLSCCWAFSAVRDARFLFVAATGVLFTYLSTAVCGMAAAFLPVHYALLRPVLDGALLLAAARAFRPVFLGVFHRLRQGWLVLSLMPLSLGSIFLSLLLVPGFAMYYTLPYVQGFTYLLALLTLFFYGASFHFFQKLDEWQEGEVDGAVLSAQVSALAGPDGDEERRRILRHDLRHYIRVLTACLRAGDAQAALRTLEALDQSVGRARAGGGEADVHGQ